MSATPDTASILIVDDEEITLRNLEHVLLREGYRVMTAAGGSEALSLLAQEKFDLVLTDLRMESVDGMRVMQQAHALDPMLEVILITGYASTEAAVAAMKEGAFYFIAKPFRLGEVRKVVAEAIAKVRLKRENRQLRQELEGVLAERRIVTQNAEMQRLLETAQQIASTDCSVLITGESGTGKELMARYLHSSSERRERPFVAINCGAFAEQLLDNELFGHEKGAFTGANSQKIGVIEASSGGTLFLDEITEMSAAMQVKLLRVLQEKEVLRLGATKPVKCDIRVLAATNHELDPGGTLTALRRDLYYRINVVNLHLPPLARRREDIPLLAGHFLQRYSQRMGRQVQQLAPDVLAVLAEHAFPGNVRELENIIERGVALATGDTLELAHLPEHLRDVGVLTFRKHDGRLPTLDEQERAYIGRVLAETGGNQSAAAQILGINRASLWRKLKSEKKSD